MTHHVTHRLVRDYIGRGSHDIDVKMIRRTPREYQAVCLECDWKSAVGTSTEADKALVKHRDEAVAAAQARGPAPVATLNPARDSTDDGDRVPTDRQLPKWLLAGQPGIVQWKGNDTFGGAKTPGCRASRPRAPSRIGGCLDQGKGHRSVRVDRRDQCYGSGIAGANRTGESVTADSGGVGHALEGELYGIPRRLQGQCTDWNSGI